MHIGIYLDICVRIWWRGKTLATSQLGYTRNTNKVHDKSLKSNFLNKPDVKFSKWYFIINNLSAPRSHQRSLFEVAFCTAFVFQRPSVLGHRYYRNKAWWIGNFCKSFWLNSAPCNLHCTLFRASWGNWM